MDKNQPAFLWRQRMEAFNLRCLGEDQSDLSVTEDMAQRLVRHLGVERNNDGTRSPDGEACDDPFRTVGGTHGDGSSRPAAFRRESRGKPMNRFAGLTECP